jgi:hypothetical protein
MSGEFSMKYVYAACRKYCIGVWRRDKRRKYEVPEVSQLLNDEANEAMMADGDKPLHFAKL